MLALFLLLSVVAACGTQTEPEPIATATPDPCAPWGCEQQARLEAAAGFVASHTGGLAILVSDRQTSAVWQAGDQALRSWAGSTPKLAYVVYLLEQARAGQVELSDQDWADIDAMLSVSDNVAAEELWDRYADPAAVMQRWQEAYGMTGASYVDGFPQRWGFVQLGVQDLANLMAYVLDRLDPADRASIVDRMRTVGGPQQWGVWGAGAPLQPGVKDGWDYIADSGSDPHRWVTSTVGFVGPGERYLVAAMYDQPAGDLESIDIGVHVLTDLVATVFGAPVPAPVVVPEDY
jgi:Beta-lactamase enzyme family